MNVVIPLAGRGSRFLEQSHRNPDYAKPKPLIPIANIPMVKWALSSYPLTGKENLIFIIRKQMNISQELRKLFGERINIIEIDFMTEGAACTALLAQKFINTEEPLLITDTDHYIQGVELFYRIKHEKCDGIIPTFYSNHPKWSYSRVDNKGFVMETAEKQVISENANIGAYYFKEGKDFVRCAKLMIMDNERVNNEFYIAPVYNYMIKKGKKIKICKPSFVYGLGVPEDVELFERLLKEGTVKNPFIEQKVVA